MLLRILSLVIEVEAESEANETLKEFKKELKSLVEKFWEHGQAREVSLVDTYDRVAHRIARPPKVYWFRGNCLIFDAGYSDGLIHIYEEKKL